MRLKVLQYSDLPVSVGGIMVSIAAFQAVDPGSIPGRRSLFFSIKNIINDKTFILEKTASVGNRTRINCLEGSYADHYTTDAVM